MAALFLYFLVFLALYAIIIHFLNKIRNFPPSPYPSLPIIGHLYLLIKKPIYRTLSKISSKHGPVILLQQGSRRLLVVSSPSVAEECLTKNDVVFANRPRLLIAKHLAYNSTSLVWAPYGDHWRNLRKIASIEVLSAYRLQMLSAIRLEEVKAMICGIFPGKRYYGENVSDVEEAKRFQAIHAEAFLLGGKTIIGDYIPWIKSTTMEKRLIEKGNLIEVLLSLQETEPEYYTDDIIKGLMMVLLLAGTHTSSATMEWALSLLLNHPEALGKARIEIDEQIGHDRLMDEADLAKLPYLRSVLNETLRMYPVAPIANPSKFRPERFDNPEGARDGFKLMPFGYGRRSCPGEGLALRVVGLALGSVIQCFEWQKIGDKMVDMTEGSGFTLPKAQPLEVTCRPRACMRGLLSQI
ncbi:CYTOCHROME P450 82C3-RELATED [Salix viminalis]|uniref:CYTOCHROME P450 82C3-RELATED n=1 Tax=Salix viminalis TaxID=40686 RepID=A0A9Q0NTY6_SALVM|nr:CYTOCHROME P450 82C3-RELATED [Salix viminalis]